MVESKKRGFVNRLKNGLHNILKIISASIFPKIAEGAEMVIKDIKDTLIQIERRILKKISFLLIIGFGGVLLIFALLFFLIDFVGWSNAAAFSFIGIIIFVIGLLLKAGEFDSE